MPGLPRSLSKLITVFCDFDGPVVDVSDRYYSTYYQALTDTAKLYRDFSSPRSHVPEPIDLVVLTKAQFWQMKQNRTPDREIAQLSGLNAAQTDYFLQRVDEIVNCSSLLHQD